jgi:hypothetical protein
MKWLGAFYDFFEIFKFVKINKRMDEFGIEEGNGENDRLITRPNDDKVLFQYDKGW